MNVETDGSRSMLYGVLRRSIMKMVALLDLRSWGQGVHTLVLKTLANVFSLHI